jgi:dihydroorotate dehydrogenase
MYKLLIRPLFFFFDPEKYIISLFLSSFHIKIPGFSAIYRSLYLVNDKRLETEVLV